MRIILIRKNFLQTDKKFLRISIWKVRASAWIFKAEISGISWLKHSSLSEGRYHSDINATIQKVIEIELLSDIVLILCNPNTTISIHSQLPNWKKFSKLWESWNVCQRIIHQKREIVNFCKIIKLAGKWLKNIPTKYISLYRKIMPICKNGVKIKICLNPGTESVQIEICRVAFINIWETEDIATRGYETILIIILFSF